MDLIEVKRRFQLVRRVGDELALAREGLAQAREQVVEALREPPDLVGAGDEDAVDAARRKPPGRPIAQALPNRSRASRAKAD